MARLLLEIVEGPGAGRQLPLERPVVVGRDAAADVVLDDERVSRQHARITPQAGGAVVEDLDSRNGTFVDGDQIYDPAHLAVGGQLLVGVTLLELRPDNETVGLTSVRAIPSSLTQFRALPAENVALTTARQVPTLATEESEPDYVPANALAGGSSPGALLPLLDTHTKGKARGAPIGIFVLVALAVILYLALR